MASPLQRHRRHTTKGPLIDVREGQLTFQRVRERDGSISVFVVVMRVDELIQDCWNGGSGAGVRLSIKLVLIE